MAHRLLSQLHHVEVVTPRPEESLRFFRDVLGLEFSDQSGQSAYLRGWGEFHHHSLQLTEGPAPTVEHIGWRTEGPDELDEVVKILEQEGAGLGWKNDTHGYGPAYRFRGPGGHIHEVFWEAERYTPPAELAPIAANRPQAFRPRGAALRRIDHVTLNSDDPLRDAVWYAGKLGFRHTENIRFDHAPDKVLGSFVSTTPMSHDLGIMLDLTGRDGKLSGMKGRYNHIAFWLDQREDVLRAADAIRDYGYKLEYGPGKHGNGENFFLYVREPGGMRVEMFSGGYMLGAPDVFPFEWKVSQGSLSYWTPDHMPNDAFLFEAFPPMPGDGAGRQAGAH